MQGVVYYPYIELPSGPWLVRALLYWDHVATIVPSDWELDRHRSLTRELARRDLIELVRPYDTGPVSFEEHISDLSGDELRRRQEAFKQGSIFPLHAEKLLVRQVRSYLSDLGLAERSRVRRHEIYDWVSVEAKTAREYMAALAIGVSHPQGYLSTRTGARWIPITQDPDRFGELIRVQSELPKSDTGVHFSRISRERRVAPFRALVFERLFPVPDEAWCYDVDLDALVRFKERHGSRLPEFRRDVESRIAGLLGADDVEEQVWRLDNLSDDLEQEISQAEAIIRRLNVERFTRSSAVQLVRHGDPTGIADKLAKGTEDVIAPDVGQAGPLAYAAFVREELMPYGRIGSARAIPIFSAPEGPLIEAVGYNAPAPRRRRRGLFRFRRGHSD